MADDPPFDLHMGIGFFPDSHSKQEPNLLVHS